MKILRSNDIKVFGAISRYSKKIRYVGERGGDFLCDENFDD